MDMLQSIIENVLTALYQPFWASLVFSVLFMVVYKTHSNMKVVVKQWLVWFKEEPTFRRLFLLVFYTVMILFRTLLNRNMWANPVSNVIGYFGLHKEDGTLTTEALENMALFMPFIILLLWNYRERILGAKIKLGKTLWLSLKITFIFSFTIEMLQLFLRLGTWQLSDLFYNTLGGFLGGLIYWCGYKITHRKRD